MSSLSDKPIVGTVKGRFVSSSGGETGAFVENNTACVKASDAIAAAYAGDTSLVPRKVAFLYSTQQKELSINQETTWLDVVNSGYSMNIVNFSYRPTVDSNLVTFHAMTQGDLSGNIYAACLLGDTRSGRDDEYEVLAIVDLGGRKKPDDFELSIDWTVKFKYGSSMEDEYFS